MPNKVTRLFFYAETSAGFHYSMQLHGAKACSQVIAMGWGCLDKAHGGKSFWEDYYLAKVDAAQLALQRAQEKGDKKAAANAKARMKEYAVQAKNAAAMVHIMVPKAPNCRIIDPTSILNVLSPAAARKAPGAGRKK